MPIISHEQLAKIYDLNSGFARWLRVKWGGAKSASRPLSGLRPVSACGESRDRVS
jgi:hypothetical protein